MPVKFGSIIHLNNSASEATMDANNLRGTTILIDNFTSESLAIIGAGLPTAPGKRRLGTIVSTTGSEDIGVKYYTYSQTSSGDPNLSGSEWTTLTNWSELSLGTTDDIDWYVDLGSNRLTSSLDVFVRGDITASGNITASNIEAASNIDTTRFTSSFAKVSYLNVLGTIESYGNISSINGNIIADNGEIRGDRLIARSGGSAAQPAISFAGDENNTGIYTPSANNLSIQVNGGATEMTLSPTQITLNTNRIRVQGHITASYFGSEINVSASGYVAANYVRLKTNTETPDAVAGGMFYSSSNEFYLGFSS